MSPIGQKLSVGDFKKQLEQDLGQIASDNNWDLAKNADRSRAFQAWCAELIFRAEPNYEAALQDVALFSRELGADIVVPDETNRQLLICHTRYRSPGADLTEVEVNDFFGRHDKYMGRGWVLKLGADYAASALADYREYIEDGWKIDYRFLTTGQALDNTSELVDQYTQDYEARKLTISCDLIDFSALKDYYVRSLSLEEAIPSSVELDLPKNLFFVRDTPYPTLIAIVKGNTLRSLYKQYRHSLYAFNIRGYLGNRGINSDIVDTAALRPGDFFYFNNGVSAVCTDFELDKNHLTAKKFQIINGAQTVTSLAQQEPDSKIEVLFRLTKTLSVATEKGINQDIIRFNNTQNAIKISDFRSNDSLQLFLEAKLRLDKAHGPLTPFHYVRKRSVVGRKGPGFSVRLEDLAKIRYSYLYEPTLAHASPKLLWTLSGDDEVGSYNKAFGVQGELQDIWTPSILDEAKLMIAVHQHLLAEAKASGVRDPELRFLHRLRFHSLALCGLYLHELRDEPKGASQIIASKSSFDTFLKEYWTVGRMVLIFSVKQYMKDGGSLFAYVRSAEEWKSLADTFRLQLRSGS